MRNLYLLLTVVGTLIPVVLFLEHFDAHGADPVLFLRSGFATLVASALTADLFIASAVFWAWIFSRHGARDGAPNPWPFVALNLLVGLSCALPLYLYLTSRDVAGAGSYAPAAR